MKKEVKIFNEKFSEVLTNIPGLRFLDFEEESVAVKSNVLEINGTDGVLLGPSNFGPFNLTLNFSFKGKDNADLRLLKQKLREVLFKREPYYVWHSDMPGKKYAVYCEESDNNTLTNSFATFSIKFTVYKGYSESLMSTGEMDLSDHKGWQFGNGYLAFDETDDFHHRSQKFRIFNGSTDTIDPTLRHILNITVHANAPKGFKIRNLTTGDEFIYKGSLLYTDTFMLKGVYPVKNGKRVGIDTNMSWITLDEGFNYFVIEGEGLSDFDIIFSFNFIYR